MLKHFLFITMTAMAFTACQNAGNHTHSHGDHDHDHAHDHEHADTEMMQGDGKHFGEKISDEGVIEMSALLTEMEARDSVPAKVVARVESVCQTKGCWMNVEGPDGEMIFVQFKDYGFFMPKDIAGRQVIMDGYGYREMTSVDELRHYAEDEGASQEEIEAITEPEEQLKFLASGVILVEE